MQAAPWSPTISVWRKPPGALVTAWAIVGMGCLVAVVALLVALTGGRPTLIEVAVLAPESVAIGFTAYIVGLRPVLEIGPDGIVVRNCLKTTTMAWSELVKVVPERIGLVVYTAAGRLPVSAVPDGGRRVGGQLRSEVVAEELASSVGSATGVAPGLLLGSRPALSAGERRRERVVVIFGLAVSATWAGLLVASLMTPSK